MKTRDELIEELNSLLDEAREEVEEAGYEAKEELESRKDSIDGDVDEFTEQCDDYESDIEDMDWNELRSTAKEIRDFCSDQKRRTLTDIQDHYHGDDEEVEEGVEKENKND